MTSFLSSGKTTFLWECRVLPSGGGPVEQEEGSAPLFWRLRIERREWQGNDVNDIVQFTEPHSSHSSAISYTPSSADKRKTLVRAYVNAFIRTVKQQKESFNSQRLTEFQDHIRKHIRVSAYSSSGYLLT